MLFAFCILSNAQAQSSNSWEKSYLEEHSAPFANKSTNRTKLPALNGQDPTTQDVPVPIDGGIAVLLLAGAVYGKRRYNQRKMQAAR